LPPRPIVAVVWTPGKSDIVPTQKAARERMQAWREEYEAKGWLVRGGVDALIATSPEGEKHAIAMHRYDPVTKQRIERPLPPILTPEQVREKYLAAPPEREAPKRRGRRPVAA